jgi:hypothetical protein
MQYPETGVLVDRKLPILMLGIQSAIPGDDWNIFKHWVLPQGSLNAIIKLVLGTEEYTQSSPAEALSSVFILFP